MKTILTSCSCVLVLLGACCFDALANDPSAQEAAMMQKFQEAATPGKEHKVLQPLVGKWKATSSWKMSAEAPAEKSTAMVERSWILGGRFVQEEYKDQSKDKPFEGIGIMGYDKVLSQYSSTWLDTMNTATWRSTGEADKAGKTISFKGEGSCPLTGAIKHNRSELTIVSKNKNVFKMYDLTPEGKEFLALEIEYERVG